MTRSEHIVCKLCSSSRLRQRPFGYQFNGKWLQAWECLDCGIIFIDPQPTPEEIHRLYSREYFEGDFRCGHEGSYFDERPLDRLSNPELFRIIKNYKPKGKFLEVGCAGGALLNAARQEGYEVYGVEFSDEAASFARQRFSLNVFTGDVHSAKFNSEMFDIVYLGDVLEHLANPRETLAELRRIIVDGGLLVLECPTQTNTLFSRAGFFMYGVLGKKATVQLPPYHLFEYRPKSMTELLRLCGFSILRKKEGMISPGEISLRGTALQKIGKTIFQYPNYVVTRITGILGDRIQIFATKKENRQA